MSAREQTSAAGDKSMRMSADNSTENAPVEPTSIESAGETTADVAQTPPKFQSRYKQYGHRIPVNNWNGTDVEGKDGPLQHGTIIAAEPDGLTVDFGCHGQRHQLVPYGAAFRCSPWVSLRGLEPGCGVEVLVCTCPWLWRPATLLAAGIPDPRYGEMICVEIHLGGVSRREIVESQQVRLPLSRAERKAFKKDDFRIWSISPLTVQLAVMLPTSSPLWKSFVNDLMKCVWPISVSTEVLHLLGPSGSTASWQSELDYVIQQTTWDISRRISHGAKEWPCCLPVQCDSVLDGSAASAGGEWTLHEVNQDLLLEAFTFLDTMERTRLRRVCHAVDALICQLSGEVWINCHQYCCDVCCDCWDYLESYQLTAPILKCMTSYTRRIIITNGGKYSLTDLLVFLGVCGKLGLCDLRQPVEVVAYRCSMIGKEDYGFWDRAEYFAECMASGCCSGLRLLQCTLPLYPTEVTFSGLLPMGWEKVDLCRLVEAHLPAVNVQRNAEWVAQAVQMQPSDQSTADRRDILEELLDYSRPDPRATNVYRKYNWTGDNLAGLDVAKLSRVALYQLSRYVNSTRNLFEELPFPNSY